MESKRSLRKPLLDEPSSSHSIYGKPVSLDLGGEVFLSHSGKDKDFVWFLYEQLCRRYHSKIAFFDVESLPKATAVSMKNILEEARRSKLGVLVLTEDFFMQTPNPMLELEAFVASEVRLLPLFFKMSVDEFKEKSQRANWENRWRTWFAENRLGCRSSVEEMIKTWRHALDIVSTFSGLEYCKVANNQPEYIDKIVDKVTSIIPPVVSYSDEGVFGKDRLCQIVDDMYKECALKCSYVDYTTQVASTDASHGLRKDSGCRMLDLVGLYGFAGLGKTTLCKSLCDFYFQKFHGKVCYIDLASDQGSSPNYSFKAFIVRMQRMLSTLTDYSCAGLHSFDVNQVKNVLRKQLSSLKNPIFLAIDVNMRCPDLEFEAEEEIGFYLTCGFPKGSKVFITSRSRDLLINLRRVHGSICVVIDYMPALNLEEARDIFVHEIGSLPHSSGISNAEDEVNMCVQMCILNDLMWKLNHYHPLMLKSLAASIRKDPHWRAKLERLRSEGLVDKIDALKKVFSMLDITFAILSKEAQTLFLDFSLCGSTRNGRKTYAWIKRLYSHLHKSRIKEIFLQLQDLCFIENKLQAPLNLLVDFCKYKVTQGDYAQHYEVVEGDARWRDDIPKSIRYVSVSQCRYNHVGETTCLDLRSVETLEVLHLVDNAARVQKVLVSSSTCAHLRSLIVRVPRRTSVCFIIDVNWSSSAVGQLRRHQGMPGCMLYWLELKGNVCFKPLRRSEEIRSWVANKVGLQALRHLVVTEAPVVADLGSSVLGQLQNLESLHLSYMPVVQSINVMTCRNLKGLNLVGLPCLRSIAGLDKSTSLKYVIIEQCNRLRTLTIADNSTSYILLCRSLKRVSFCTTRLNPGADCGTTPERALGISFCPNLRKVDGLSKYTGSFKWFDYFPVCSNSLKETFADLLKSAAIDSSICKASVITLELAGHPPGLAGVECMILRDAQHIRLLTSALFKAQPHQILKRFEIHCKKGGDCGCDTYHAPQFGALPHLTYGCPQVRDVSNLFGQWDVVTSLDLRGCKSVEVWPDFATLTSLLRLDLGYTSLKEWPTSLLLLRELKSLGMKGCRQLPAEELMKVITKEPYPAPEQLACSIGSLESLLLDVKAGERDGCLVVNALLELHYPEIVALFHRCSCYVQTSNCVGEAGLILEIMYEVLITEGEAGCLLPLKFTKAVKDLILPFIKSFCQVIPASISKGEVEVYEELLELVGKAVYKMARVPSVAAELELGGTLHAVDGYLFCDTTFMEAYCEGSFIASWRAVKALGGQFNSELEGN